MDWTCWGLVLLVGLALGGLAYSRRETLRAGFARYGRWLRLRLHRFSARRRRPRPTPAPAPQQDTAEEAVILMPDGRPWPLGPGLQLLELAWRWQVVHGTNLPLRARHGEGAYVWRPPLPVRNGAADQQSADAEP